MTFDPKNFDPKNIESLKEKSAEIQNKMSDVQNKLATIEVEGKSGAGDYSVKVHLNGRYEATKVIIDSPLLQQPVQVLCELVASAITDAAHKAETAIQNEMVKLFQNFKLPGNK